MNIREILSASQRQQQRSQYKRDRQQNQWSMANRVQNTLFAGVDPQTGQFLSTGLAGGVVRGISITSGALPRNSWIAATISSSGSMGTLEGKARG